MSITGGIVLFVTVWFLMMFIILPIKARSQAEDGEVVAGTPAGAPSNFRFRRTALIVTFWAVLVWGILAAIILSGMITVEDLDWLGVLGERVPN